MDLSKDLYGYEIEYHVLQEEMQKTPHHGEDVISRLEQANHNLKRQNLELLEQLQAARSQSHSSEIQLHTVHSNQNKLKSHIRTLELERAALLNAVSKLRKLIPEEVLEDSDVNIPSLSADKTITNSPIHNPLVNRFLEDLDVKLTSSSLTEFDREVSALMMAKHRKLSDQGQSKSMKVPPQSRSNEFLTVESARNERPASSNY
jgi:chromosome segregation ATPase